MRLERSFATYGARRVAFHVVGNGPPVLLLHGLGGTADFWRPAIDALAGRFRLIAPDLLGFGFSDKPAASRYTPGEHVAALGAVLRAADTQTLHAVVGHSCGGPIAIALLAAGVCTAGRLVLTGAPYPAPRFPLRRELLRSPLDRAMLSARPVAHFVHELLTVAWPLLGRIPVPTALEGAWEGYMEHTIHSYASTAEHCLFGANIDPWLPAVRRIPSLVLFGRDDRSVPPLHGERLAAVLPRSELRLVDGGHYSVVRTGLPSLCAWLGG